MLPVANAPTVSDWTLVAGASLLALYTAFTLVYDRCLSTRPSRNLLVQTLEGLRDCAGWPRPSNPAAGAEYDRVKAEANQAIERAERVLQSNRQQKKPGWPRHFGVFIESTKVLAMWREAHRIERLCWTVAPSSSQLERLKTARAELDAIDSLTTGALVTRIDTFTQPPPSPHTPETLTAWIYRKLFPLPKPPTRDARPLLQQALIVANDHRDTTYESLADRQTKGAWFTVLGAALIVLAALTYHRESFLLLGAAGGVLSRVLRLLRRSPGAMDYGVSSATFMLAPIVGALSGWVGVILVQALANLHVLSAKSFGAIWDHPDLPRALAIAFAFGFTERLLDRFAATTVNALTTTQAGTATAVASSTPPKPQTPPAGT